MPLSPIDRYSANRLLPMKKAPTSQYDAISESGGTAESVTANQPSMSRSGLLTDSEITSRYGSCFVLSGGTLYTRPMMRRAAAEPKNGLFTTAASASPIAANAIHSQ